MVAAAMLAPQVPYLMELNGLVHLLVIWKKKLHCKMLGGYLVLIVQASILAQLGRWGSFYAFPIPPEIIYEGHNHPAFLIYRNILFGRTSS